MSLSRPVVVRVIAGCGLSDARVGVALRMKRGRGASKGSSNNSESTLEGSEGVLDVRHGVVLHDAQDGRLPVLIEIGYDCPAACGK